MVSNASEDLPEPLGPVKTTILPRGRLRLTFFRLCCRAPTTTSLSTVARTGSTARRTTRGAPVDSRRNQLSSGLGLGLGLGQGRGQVAPEVLDALDAHTESQQPVGDAGREAV